MALRIFKRFVELFDAPVPANGKVLGWSAGVLANFDMPGITATVDHIVLAYTSGVLTLVTKWADAGQTVLAQTTTLSYTSGVLTQVVVADYVAGILSKTTTKTLNYTSGVLTSVGIVVA
jgi:hypothetical protein